MAKSNVVVAVKYSSVINEYQPSEITEIAVVVSDKKFDIVDTNCITVNSTSLDESIDQIIQWINSITNGSYTGYMWSGKESMIIADYYRSIDKQKEVFFGHLINAQVLFGKSNGSVKLFSVTSAVKLKKMEYHGNVNSALDEAINIHNLIKSVYW